MARNFKLNRLELVAIAAGLVSTWLCIGLALDAADMYRTHRSIPPAAQVLGVCGWLVATFGPLALAVGFRRLAGRFRAPWLLHLLFLPGAVALLLAGDRIMLFVTGTIDFDDTIGGPVIQAALLFIVAVVAYFTAALWTAVVRRRR